MHIGKFQKAYISSVKASRFPISRDVNESSITDPQSILNHGSSINQTFGSPTSHPGSGQLKTFFSAKYIYQYPVK